MTEEEKIICKSFLHDADNTHSCNEYKLLMELLEQEPCEDAVSRAEVLNLVRFNAFHVKSQIKAIENMPSVTPQEPILDKIRAEIWDLQYGDEEKSMTDEDRADAYNNAIRQVIEIIDKYKSESEGNK